MKSTQNESPALGNFPISAMRYTPGTPECPGFWSFVTPQVFPIATSGGTVNATVSNRVEDDTLLVCIEVGGKVIAEAGTLEEAVSRARHYLDDSGVFVPDHAFHGCGSDMTTEHGIGTLDEPDKGPSCARGLRYFVRVGGGWQGFRAKRKAVAYHKAD